MQRNDTTAIYHPSRHADQTIHVRQPAMKALAWWQVYAEQGFAPEGDDLEYGKSIEASAAGDPVLAALIDMAREHLAGAADQFGLRRQQVAALLRDEHNHLEPLPVYVPAAQDDRCRHGKPFSEDCADCDL